jgi:hypothetical protein
MNNAFGTTSTAENNTESHAADVLIPIIRTAATIGFAVAPCSLGFVIIAVSEQLIRSIMVGDDPEMLLSDLQNQFPNDTIEVADGDAGLVAQVVDLIDRPEQAGELPFDRASEFQMPFLSVLDPRARRMVCKTYNFRGGTHPAR